MPPTIRKLMSVSIPILLMTTLATASPALASDGGPPPAAAAVADAGPPAPQPPPTTTEPDGDVIATPGGAVDQATKDPVGTVAAIVRDIRDGGPYRYAAAGVLVLIMAAGVRFQSRIFGSTKRGRAAALMTFSTLGAVFTALAGDVPISPGLFAGAIGVAWTAAGGRTWLASLLWPEDGATHWLGWLKPWLGVK